MSEFPSSVLKYRTLHQREWKNMQYKMLMIWSLSIHDQLLSQQVDCFISVEHIVQQVYRRDCALFSCKQTKLDGVGPVDNRPSTD